jgi:hypothetical protein
VADGEVRSDYVGQRMVHVLKRLIHTGVKTTNAQVLIVVEAIKERPAGLDVVGQAAQILSLLERCTERA